VGGTEMIKIITNRCSQCSGIMFGQLSNTGDYYCKCSYAEIEKPSYTAQDMEAFAEFLIGRNTEWITELEKNETAKTLIELWEKQRKEATEL
jgi:hypothetical protein